LEAVRCIRQRTASTRDWIWSS